MRVAHALLLAVALAVPARAAVFRDVVYVRGASDERAQSLDVYTPATPGPHALVLYLAGTGQDKGATRGRHAAFNAHGMVFVSANRREQPRAAALDDAAALLAWAQRNASRYGGDVERTYLLAAGDAAELALAAGDDAARRATLAVARGMPAGIVALAPAALPGVAGSSTAPRLLLFDARDSAMHARVDDYVDRARGAGVAAQALPSSARNAAMLARDFGTPTDADVAQVLAWLDSRAIARVPRFEQLVFAADALPADTPAVDGLVTDGDSLLVATRGGDGTARIVARAGGGAVWGVEAEWPASRMAVLATGAGAVHGVRVAEDVSWCTRVAREWRCTPIDGLVGAVPTQALELDGRWYLATDHGAFRIDGNVAQRDSPEDASDIRLLACDGALHAAAGGSLWRREPARWQRIARWLGGQDANAAARTLACVPDPAGSGREAVLVALADGRVLRVDAAGASVTVEIDTAAAFRELWREPSLRVAFARMPAAALLHPDSGDLVHAFALELAHEGTPRAGAWWLLRTLDASYAYGPVRDFSLPSSPPAVVAAALQMEGAVLVATSGSGAALLHGELAAQGPRTGLWSDPDQPGEAIELARDGDAWTAIVHDHDRDGMTRWTVHAGTLRDATFVAGGDVAQPGALRIAFAGDAADCRAPRARATMVRDGATARWCLQPFSLPQPGRPTIDGSGTWRSAAPGEHWELATAAHGFDGNAAAWVLLRWIDERERPRWLFGMSDYSRGALRVTLGTGRCPACSDAATGELDLHFLGACGEGGGVVTLEVRDDARIVLGRAAIAIEAVARKPCY